MTHRSAAPQSPETREGRSRPISAASSARAAAREAVVTKLGAAIVGLLTNGGPMHTPGICRALDRDYAATVPIMTALVKVGAVKIVGTAAKWGFRDVKSSAPVYGATGAPIRVKVNERGRPELPVAEPELQPPHNTRRRDARQRTNSGSGVIAGKIEIGRGYNWKAGFV